MRNSLVLFVALYLMMNASLYTCFNCKRNADIDKCNSNNNTICSDSGVCVCSQYYYGQNCDKILQNSNSLLVYSSGFSLSGYIGLIVGLVISFPVVLVTGLLIIYFTLKDRDY